MINQKKLVSFPILVPVGGYCWKPDEQILCDYYDNTGGHNHCEMDFPGQINTPEGHCKKPSGCEILAEILGRRK